MSDQAEGALATRQPALPAVRTNKRLAKVFETFKHKAEIEFPVYAISSDPQEVARVIKENMGAQGLTEFDLDAVKVPTGGRTSWEIPQLDGEAEDVKTFEGIIVYFKDARRFWKTSFDESGGGMPPDCAAESDGEVEMYGRGEPGGSCKTCPNAQFGSATKGAGQACRTCRPLFIIRPDEVMPSVVPLPPTSIAACRKFFLRLGNKSIPYYAVVVRFGLRKTRSKAGQEYAEVQFAVSGILNPNRPNEKTPSQVEVVEAYQNQVMPELRRMRVGDDKFEQTRDVDEEIRERDGGIPPDGDTVDEGRPPDEL